MGIGYKDYDDYGHLSSMGFHISDYRTVFHVGYVRHKSQCTGSPRVVSRGKEFLFHCSSECARWGCLTSNELQRKTYEIIVARFQW
jgi:hypothetical protein